MEQEFSANGPAQHSTIHLAKLVEREALHFVLSGLVEVDSAAFSPKQSEQVKKTQNDTTTCLKALSMLIFKKYLTLFLAHKIDEILHK